MTSSSANNQVYSHSDRPISGENYDELGAKEFSHALAQSIVGWHETECLTIGLYGTWGNGKTSIKNMCLEWLSSNSAHFPMTQVQYNPWTLDGSKGIVESFFEELGEQLGDSSAEELKAASKELKNLSALFAGTIPLLGLLANLAAPGSGNVLEKLLQGAQKTFDREALAKEEVANATFKQVKKRLDGYLAKSPQKVLVVIDDIDRLLKDDIRTLFRLVKSTADFPNVIYLLLFDKTVVSNSLTEDNGSAGKDFLQKIIQVDLTVPKYPKERLTRYFDAKVRRLLDSKGISYSADYLAEMLELVSEFTPNLRSVHRLLNSYAFHLGVLTNERVLEINPIDLLALEVLRVFDDFVYHYIYRNLGIFAPSSTQVLITAQLKDISETENQAHWKFVRENLVSDENAVLQLLKKIFPGFAKFVDKKPVSYPSEEEQIQELRICHQRISKRYFHFEVEKDDLGQGEVAELLESLKKPEAFSKSMESYANRRMLAPAFGYLLDYADSITLQQIYDNMDVLLHYLDFDVSPKARDTEKWGISLIEKVLIGESSLPKKSGALKKSLKKIDGFSQSILFLRNPSSEFLTEQHRAILKKWLLSEVKRLSSAKLLFRHKHGYRYLSAWKHLGDQKTYTSFMKRTLKVNEQFYEFAECCMSCSVSTGELSDRFSLDWVANLVDVEEFEKNFKKARPKSSFESDIHKAIEKAMERGFW